MNNNMMPMMPANNNMVPANNNMLPANNNMMPANNNMLVVDLSKYQRQPRPDAWSRTASTAVVKAFKLVLNLLYPPEFWRIITADIYIDEIFPLLLIDELLQLRQTCKAFYLLTHEIVIWKRYLRKLKIPIALSRPTFKFDSRISNYEIETIVTSACAIDRAWRGGFPRIRHERVLTAQCKVVDLCLLPGGKFLVASIKDRSNFRFFLCVYALDVLHGSRMLARIPTLYKAFDLQAKYMPYGCKPGIMIYFTRRRFVGGVPKDAQENINNFDPRVHYPTRHPMVYEGVCMHMRLDSVEKLIYPDFKTAEDDGLYDNYTGHARRLPPPFVDVFRHKDINEIHSPSLATVNNDPVLWFAEDIPGQSTIRFINLVRGADHARFSMILKDHPEFERIPHRIRAMRYLPCQKCIFVIRSTRTAPDRNDHILCEIYDMPREPGDHYVEPHFSWSFEDVWNFSGEIKISDDADFTANTPYHPDLVNHRYLPPPTIWVFAPTEKPKGFLYFYVRAEKNHRGEYRYTLSPPPRHHQNVNFHEAALAGSLRSLILEIDKHDASKTTLRRMRRFFFSEYRFTDIPVKEAEARAFADPDNPPDLMTPIPADRIQEGLDRAIMDIIRSDLVSNSINKAGGIVASAWDEMSGKICVASEAENHIKLLDVAPVVEPHVRMAYVWHKNLINPDEEHQGYIPLTLAPRDGNQAGSRNAPSVGVAAGAAAANGAAVASSSSAGPSSNNTDVDMADPDSGSDSRSLFTRFFNDVYTQFAAAPGALVNNLRPASASTLQWG